VTITHQRRSVLVHEVAASVVRAIEDAARNESFEIVVYCVMPDHVHLLALGTSDDADAVRFVQRYKQSSGYAFKKEDPAPLWQQSFYDHVLRADEDILPIARYILGNPVAAGLVSDTREWTHSGGTMVSMSQATSLHSLREASR